MIPCYEEEGLERPLLLECLAPQPQEDQPQEDLPQELPQEVCSLAGSCLTLKPKTTDNILGPTN
jgi:hypothetical protein